MVNPGGKIKRKGNETMRSIKIYSMFAYLYIIFALTTGLSSTDRSYSGYPEEITILTEQKSIMVGEPLVLQMTYILQKARLMPATQKPFSSIMHEAIVQIEDPNGGLRELPLFPRFIHLDDSQGLRYSGTFIMFYDGYEKHLVLGKPGTYKIRAFVTKEHFSNTLNISVQEASKQQSEALSTLSSPNEYFFLEAGEHGEPQTRSETILRVQQVIDQGGDILLSKWAAARLGIEESKELEKKYPDVEKFWNEYRQGKMKEPLLDQAQSHLSKALNLPDEFPIREQILYELPKVEFIKGNYKKARSLLDELAHKYPHGEYGMRAEKAKRELLGLMEREQPAPAFRTRPTLLIGALAAIVVLLFVLLLRKIVISRSK